MAALHADAELAPRDVVARAVHREVVSGRGAFLDCRAAIGPRIATAFPAVHAACMAANIDPAHEPIPVAPAAHYHMGGVWTDAVGRTSVDQLWACGEVACTGVHGANRLASNSLLEAIVMGARIAEDIARFVPGWRTLPAPEFASDAAPLGGTISTEALARLRETVSAQVGMERTQEGLTQALRTLAEIEADEPASAAIRNIIASARFITVSALMRTESRGSHYRADYPDTNPHWRRHTLLTLKKAEAAAARATQLHAPVRLSA